MIAGVGGRMSQELGGLLSLALVELLLSFPFSLFLLLDLDLVILCSKLSTKIALSAHRNTLEPEMAYFPTMPRRKARET